MRNLIMLDFRRYKDPATGEEWIETSLSGKPLLSTTQLNKSTAFSKKEREAFGLLGKLPPNIETIEQQVQRAYLQYSSYKHKINKNIYLNELHDSNQVLFYRLVSEHLAEMLPVIYTPIVGNAVKQFSHSYRTPRGLYISYTDKDNIEILLENRSNPEIDLIVVTDGEGVLGIGDQGIGGMDIPIAKLMVYSLCGGINPNRTLPILLDVGTNNEELLEDPMYLGLKHPRYSGAEYDAFIEKFVTAVKKIFPNVFLHWEDFGRENARRNLEKYQKQVCTFNDDMQGTGVVTLSAILAAAKATGSSLLEQRVVVFGAGTAGTGIADQIRDAMCHEGLPIEEANRRFWLLDKPGLLTTETPELTDFQRPYAHSSEEIQNWVLEDDKYIGLYDVVKNIKPTILIGSSAVAGAFNKKIIDEMASHTERPIILPLSNPTERAEAIPEDLYQWTQGKVLIATGSPFPSVAYEGSDIPVAQCNNALVFPGIGLGLIVSQAKELTDEALWVACKTLSDFAPITKDPKGSILPNMTDVKEVSVAIAIAVATQVMKEGHGGLSDKTDLKKVIEEYVWKPDYIPLVKI